ncbi:MAG: hypothetical protein R3F16_17000 [Myxococcota bacterium]
MELVMIFDMRAPTSAPPREALFAAALDMAEWADRVGFDVIGFGEHHGSEDGYNPSPRAGVGDGRAHAPDPPAYGRAPPPATTPSGWRRIWPCCRS